MRHLDDCFRIASEFFYDARDRADAEPVIQAAQILCSETQPGDEHRLRQSKEGRVTAKPRRKEFVRRLLQDDRKRFFGGGEGEQHEKVRPISPPLTRPGNTLMYAIRYVSVTGALHDLP